MFRRVMIGPKLTHYFSVADRFDQYNRGVEWQKN